MNELAHLVAGAVERCELDLAGERVLTEAATGAYVVTPVIAALAGAEVVAFTRATGHGSVEDVRVATTALADELGVASRIRIVDTRTPLLFAHADVVTNSGHLRPLTTDDVGAMPATACIPLMYEAWELRPQDVDVASCRRRGIALAGTNESHPKVAVFPYLGAMAVKLLADAGLPARGTRVLLLSDNPFRAHVERGLRDAGVRLEARTEWSDASFGPWDAVIVAQTPASSPRFGAAEAKACAVRAPGALVAQFWGDVDRGAVAAAGLRAWPRASPGPGHMGILPSALGPEPIVRLQSGGLKVAEVLRKARRAGRSWEEAERDAEASGWGQRLSGSS